MPRADKPAPVPNDEPTEGATLPPEGFVHAAGEDRPVESAATNTTRRPSAVLDRRTMAIDSRADSGGDPPRAPSSTSRLSSSTRRSNSPAVTSAFDVSIGVGAEL